MKTRMGALAAEAHLTLTLLHLQGVVFHMVDEKHRSLPYAAVHFGAAVFSGVSFLRHLREEGTQTTDYLKEHYQRVAA